MASIYLYLALVPNASLILLSCYHVYANPPRQPGIVLNTYIVNFLNQALSLIGTILAITQGRTFLALNIWDWSGSFMPAILFAIAFLNTMILTCFRVVFAEQLKSSQILLAKRVFFGLFVLLCSMNYITNLMRSFQFNYPSYLDAVSLYCMIFYGLICMFADNIQCLYLAKFLKSKSKLIKLKKEVQKDMMKLSMTMTFAAVVDGISCLLYISAVVGFRGQDQTSQDIYWLLSNTASATIAYHSILIQIIYRMVKRIMVNTSKDQLSSFGDANMSVIEKDKPT